MASKKQESTALSTERVKFDLQARPDFIKAGDTRGTENITQADIKPPALRLAQANSHEVKRADAKYIEDLREGDFFNSITKEIYGENVSFIVVSQLGHRNVEFEPGGTGVVVDFDVPDNDPRTQFTNDVVDGKKVRVKPVATKFYDYLVLLIREDGREPELMAMSLKSTQLKKAVQLNTILAGLKMPSFAVVFSAASVSENGKGNSWMGWKIDMAGWASEPQFREAEKAYEMTKGKTIALETEAEGDEGTKEDIPF